MGFNTVAVLYNDFDFSKQPDMHLRIHAAMRGWSWRDRDRLATHFGAGQVISQAHADYPQVVIVGKNTGYPLHEANDLDGVTLNYLAECLKRHGWTVKEPSLRKRVKALTAS